MEIDLTSFEEPILSLTAAGGHKTLLGARQAAIARGLRQGAAVRILYRVRLKSGEYTVKSEQMGRVTALYAHIFVCEAEGKAVCLRYNEVIGEESTKVEIL